MVVAASTEELRSGRPGAKYMVFRTRRGPLLEVVPQVWHEIWSYFQQSADKRTYTGITNAMTCEFDPANTVVDVYIAIE